jgi:apolipoprotein N-acyltransferase
MVALPLLLTISSALLYALSFPPFSLFPLAWVALVPFFLAASMVRPVAAAACGILWGMVMACGVAWCLPAMLVNYFQVSTLVSWAGFFAVGIGLSGIYYGAFAAWLSWLVRRQAASPLLLAAGWGACEFARANLLIGNPWALSGYSQVPFTRLMQIADTTGPYRVGMLIAAVNACLAGFVSPTLRSRRPALSRIGVVAACGAALLYGEWRLSQPFATGEPVTVAVIQGAIEQKNGRNTGHSETRLQRYLTLTKEAGAAHPALIFWPEYAVDFPLQHAPERTAVLAVAQELGADLILGSPHYGYGIADFYHYNSVFLIRGGKLAGRYDKLRLLPVAEGEGLGWLFPQRTPGYQPGRRLHVLGAGAARVGAFVCFEAMYPDLVRRFALQGAEVLANPSNDSWFGHAVPARHQLDIAAVRAIENRRYLVRPTTTGFSAIIDLHGRVAVLSDFGAPAVLMGSVRPSQAQTLYQRWGDAASWIVIAFAIVTSLYYELIAIFK